MATQFLITGPAAAQTTLLLAHGAGGAMDSPAMEAMAESLGAAGLRVARFEFGYMASRRTASVRKPPPRADTLMSEYLSAVSDIEAKGTLIIGGKSMGGRVASMIADELFAAGRIQGLLCLGYPFHPVGKPDQLRVSHLAGLKTPALIVQGTRDPFGSRDEVAAYDLPPSIDIVWLDDGDHDFRPRKKISGYTVADHLRTMGEAVRAWTERLPAMRR